MTLFAVYETSPAGTPEPFQWEETTPAAYYRTEADADAHGDNYVTRKVRCVVLGGHAVSLETRAPLR
jgi:hypothetical protein